MNVTLYRNCHDPGQVRRVAPPFTALDATANARPEWREWQSLFRIHDERLHARGDYCGLFSSRFEIKTKLSGSDILGHMAANPGHDVYLFSSNLRFRYFAYNDWAFAEAKLPGIWNRAQLLLDRGRTGIRLDDLGRSTVDRMVHSNFWVARPAVWDALMRFVRPLAALVETDAEIRAALMDTFWHRGRYEPYLPYVFEYMTPTFLMLNPGIRTSAYPFTRSEIAAQSVYAVQRPVIEGFADLIDGWDPIATTDRVRRRVLENLCRTVHDYYHLSGENDRDPWGERGT